MVLVSRSFASFFPLFVFHNLYGNVIGGNEEATYVFEAEKNLPINNSKFP